MEEIGVSIPIEGGKYIILVSECDAYYVRKYRWMLDGKGYVYRRWMIKGIFYREWLHQYILGVEVGLEGDHRNQNRLDCRRSNLRHSTHSQNLANRQQRVMGKYSKYRGVTKDKRRGRWMAQIQANMVHYNLGLFDTEQEAARAYNQAAFAHFGEFACLNNLAEGTKENPEGMGDANWGK